MYAHTTGDTALNLFLLIFFFAQKWWLEISKWWMMGNNFKRQKIVVLPRLLLKRLIKSLDVRGCQMTVSVSEFYQSLPVFGRLAHVSKYSSDQLSAYWHTGGKTHHAVKTGICPGCPKGLSVSFRSELAWGSGPGAPSGESLFLVSTGVETHRNIYGKKKRLSKRKDLVGLGDPTRFC